MGFLKRMFGMEDPKVRFIKDLVKERIIFDQAAERVGYKAPYVDDAPDGAVMGLPEASIAVIVESYVALKRQGLSDESIFRRIEEHRSMNGGGIIPGELNLKSYIKYRFPYDHPTGELPSDRFLELAIEKARKFFSQ